MQELYSESRIQILYHSFKICIFFANILQDLPSQYTMEKYSKYLVTQGETFKKDPFNILKFQKSQSAVPFGTFYIRDLIDQSQIFFYSLGVSTSHRNA